MSRDFPFSTLSDAQQDAEDALELLQSAIANAFPEDDPRAKRAPGQDDAWIGELEAYRDGCRRLMVPRLGPKLQRLADQEHEVEKEIASVEADRSA